MFLHKMGIGLIGLMKPKRKKRLTSWFQSPQERGEAVCSQGSDQGPAPSWALGGHVPHRLTQETGPALSPAPQMRDSGPEDCRLTLKVPRLPAEEAARSPGGRARTHCLWSRTGLCERCPTHLWGAPTPERRPHPSPAMRCSPCSYPRFPSLLSSRRLKPTSPLGLGIPASFSSWWPPPSKDMVWPAVTWALRESECTRRPFPGCSGLLSDFDIWQKIMNKTHM